MEAKQDGSGDAPTGSRGLGVPAAPGGLARRPGFLCWVSSSCFPAETVRSGLGGLSAVTAFYGPVCLSLLVGGGEFCVLLCRRHLGPLADIFLKAGLQNVTA